VSVPTDVVMKRTKASFKNGHKHNATSDKLLHIFVYVWQNKVAALPVRFDRTEVKYLTIWKKLKPTFLT